MNMLAKSLMNMLAKALVNMLAKSLGVISTLFLWKKLLNDVIILKDDLVKVSLSAISGYRLGHVDYFDKFQVTLRMNWSFISTLISMY